MPRALLKSVGMIISATPLIAATVLLFSLLGGEFFEGTDSGALPQTIEIPLGTAFQPVADSPITIKTSTAADQIQGNKRGFLWSLELLPAQAQLSASDSPWANRRIQVTFDGVVESGQVFAGFQVGGVWQHDRHPGAMLSPGPFSLKIEFALTGELPVLVLESQSNKPVSLNFRSLKLSPRHAESAPMSSAWKKILAPAPLSIDHKLQIFEYEGKVITRNE